MNAGEIIREVSRIQGVKITEIARSCGYARVNGLSNRINEGGGIRSDLFAKILKNINGAELIVRDKDGNEWVVDPQE